MNRYSRVSTSQFNPMTMQEIFMVPLAKQQQHDQLMAASDELGLFNVKALDQDVELRDSYINDYNSKLESLAGELSKNGINNMSKQKLRSLAKEKQNWLTKGQGKDIATNYAAYQTNKEELDKLYQAGKINRDKYMLGLNSAKQGYKGVAQGDTYSPFTAVHDTDFEKRATEIAKAINGNPKKIVQFSGLHYNPATGKYVDMRTNREFTESGAIRQAVKAGLMMDPEIMSDLNQRQQLGILGNNSVEQYVDAMGLFNEAIYAKDNVTGAAKQYVGIDHKQLDKEKDPTQSDYELGNARSFGIRTKNLGDKLGDIINDRENFSVDKDAENFNTSRGTAMRPGNTIAKYENLRENEKQEYDLLYDKLRKTGAIGKDYAKTSPEAMGAIKNYMDSFATFTYQPIKYTDGIVKTYDKMGSSFKRSTPKELADAIANNPEDRFFYDLNTGKEVKFEDLPAEEREQLMKGNGKVVAAHGARNDYKNELQGLTIQDRVLTAPLELQLGDNHKYLVSRSEREMSSPQYRIDTEVNKIWSDLVRTPHLPNEYNLPYTGKTELTRLSDGKTKVRTKNGEEILNSDEELERFINFTYKGR